MRILFAHVDHSPGIAQWYQSVAAEAAGEIDVRCFCVTLNPPGPNLDWPELDRLWKARDPLLLSMYDRLQEAAVGCDALLLYNGANLHPEFLSSLPTFNVYCCFDDPESSHLLSAPVAAAFDGVFYGNIASRFQYEKWGCRRAAFLPIFNAPGDVPPREQEERILSAERDIDIAYVGVKTDWRRGRLSMLSAAFPEARCHGQGWPFGMVDESGLHDLYRRARVGWNIHNSTGPINRRLFALPAFGVLQICDNKTGLGRIFELGKEVVGFDTIPEAIELTRYYLEHEAERQEIAARGYHRFWQEYHAGAIWWRIRCQLEEWSAAASPARGSVKLEVGSSSPAALLSSRLRLARRRAREAAVRRFGANDGLRRAVRVARQMPRVLYSAPVAGFRSAIQVIEQTNAPRLLAGAAPAPRYDERVYLGERTASVKQPDYLSRDQGSERPEAEQRLAPEELALRWGITALLGPASRILVIGRGAGDFIHFAEVDAGRKLFCSDGFSMEPVSILQSEKAAGAGHWLEPDGCDGRYDLLVALDEVEPCATLPGSLRLSRCLADRAIFVASNRTHSLEIAANGSSPDRRPSLGWAPGELYWVLKQYYEEVTLYTLPDPVVPWLELATLSEQRTPIIAECKLS